MTEELCLHKILYMSLIGAENSADALVYQIYTCKYCGQYFDVTGELANFEKTVSEQLGREWHWKEEFVSPEELGKWDPETHQRIVIIP